MTKLRIAAGSGLGLLLLLGGLAWWLGYFSNTPDEVSIDAAVEAATATDNDDGSDADGSGNDGSDADGSGNDGSDSEEPASEGTDDADGDDGASSAIEGITGTWTVQSDEDATFVGYRIDEVLTTVGDFEVVGRTSDVTGSIEAEGTSISSVSVVAQMDTLTTDNTRRDSAMRSRSLQTDEFPEATFALTTPIELASIPADGETIAVTAVGDLTIHGVTRPVEFPLEAQLSGDLLVVVGQLDVLLADYDIDPPTAPVVASVEENALLELSLAFRRS